MRLTGAIFLNTGRRRQPRGRMEKRHNQNKRQMSRFDDKE